MGRHRRRRRNLAMETPSSTGDVKTAMLLYEVPSGIAIFSFDGSYLNGPAKDFWKFLPPVGLEVVIKHEKGSSPIDLANKSIDGLLAVSLTELCGPEKELVVGSAEYKALIEKELGITCLYVDVPYCEVIICYLKDPNCKKLLGFSGDASAILLYKAAFGIAIFSFNGSYLNGLTKDFWACLPPLSLVQFMAYEMVPTPIDLDNKDIDDRLAKWLKKLCHSQKTLVVGNAEYKGIIEKKLVKEKITCLCVDIPDCEVIICSLKKPMHTLLPYEEKADLVKDIILFLRQHHFDIPDGKVDVSCSAAALCLHNVELREMEYLKFFRLLLNNFMSRSGIDTKNWVLIQFATALKMICYPRALYKVYHPDKIFLSDVCSKIVDHPRGFDEGFLKIDVLSVYNEVLSLCSQKCRHLCELDALLISKAAKMKAKLEEHPSVEVPNKLCNNENKLEADNSALGSVMGESDATSTLLKNKESEDAVLHDNVRSLEDEDASATQAADASAEVVGLTEALNNDKLACSEVLSLTAQKNEHALAEVKKIDMSLLNGNEIYKVMHWLAESIQRMGALAENVSCEWRSKERRFVNSIRKLEEEIVAIMKAQMDKYLAVLNEKETENTELLKNLNILETNLLEVNKYSEFYKAEIRQVEHNLFATVTDTNTVDYGLLEKVDRLEAQLLEAVKTTEKAEALSLNLMNIVEFLRGKVNLIEADLLEGEKTSDRQLNYKLVAGLMNKENKNEGLLEKVNLLEAHLLESKKPSEEAMSETHQLKHELVAVLMEKQNERNWLLEKIPRLKAQLREAKKTTEETMVETRQLKHKLVDAVMEKENEKDGLLERANRLKAQLLIAEKTSEEVKAETPSQLKDEPLDGHLAVVIEEENEKDGLLEKVNVLEVQLLEARKMSEEAMAETHQLKDRLIAVVNEKDEEKEALLKMVNRLEARMGKKIENEARTKRKDKLLRSIKKKKG